jgi:hypothetical protein
MNMTATTSRLISSEAEFFDVLAAERAVLYVTVDWSAPERASRELFEQFSKTILADYSHLGIQLFVVPEDAEFSRQWLQAHVARTLGSLGYGSVIWFERGEVRHFVLYPVQLRTSLVDETLRVFGEKG